MPHIHTQPGQHDHTVSGYIFIKQGSEYAVLLHQHKKLNTLLQFGGHIELNETPWAAIAHELQEESGYDLTQLHVLQPKEVLPHCTNAVVHPTPCLYNTHDFGNKGEHFHTDVGYAFTTSEQPAHTLAAGESDDMQAYTYDQLVALPKGQIFDNTREMCVFIFNSILPNWQAVPADGFSIEAPSV